MLLSIAAKDISTLALGLGISRMLLCEMPPGPRHEMTETFDGELGQGSIFRTFHRSLKLAQGC